QVIKRAWGLRGDRRDLNSREVEFGLHRSAKRPLTDKVDGTRRLVAGRKRLDDIFERNVLVCQYLPNGISNTRRQIRESRIASGVNSKHDVVDKQSDQILDFGAVSASERRTNCEISFSGMAIKQGNAGSQRRTEHCAGLLVGEGLQGICDGPRQKS